MKFYNWQEASFRFTIDSSILPSIVSTNWCETRWCVGVQIDILCKLQQGDVVGVPFWFMRRRSILAATFFASLSNGGGGRTEIFESGLDLWRKDMTILFDLEFNCSCRIWTHLFIAESKYQQECRCKNVGARDWNSGLVWLTKEKLTGRLVKMWYLISLNPLLSEDLAHVRAFEHFCLCLRLCPQMDSGRQPIFINTFRKCHLHK